METFFYMLIIGAAVGMVLGLLVQIVGTFLIGALTVGVGVRDWWVNKWSPHQPKQDVLC